MCSSAGHGTSPWNTTALFFFRPKAILPILSPSTVITLPTHSHLGLRSAVRDLLQSAGNHCPVPDTASPTRRKIRGLFKRATDAIISQRPIAWETHPTLTSCSHHAPWNRRVGGSIAQSRKISLEWYAKIYPTMHNSPPDPLLRRPTSPFFTACLVHSNGQATWHVRSPSTQSAVLPPLHDTLAVGGFRRGLWSSISKRAGQAAGATPRDWYVGRSLTD
jgi:hypothetical protein